MRKGVFDKNEAIETLVRSLPLGMNKGIDGMVCINVTDDIKLDNQQKQKGSSYE